eukprot:TRINITY_DN22398_c0_g1_i1.p3 TRINITY_DN22398_c0_g1~~TRINITY_DN22398_c0_g1_i1.p3  ORF type:complete len:192 (+),score=64.62 TRINITY_DN22398_c0_g1_i1:30-578(+)
MADVDKEEQRLMRAMSNKKGVSRASQTKGTPEWKRRQRQQEEERKEKEAQELAKLSEEQKAQRAKELAQMELIRNAASAGNTASARDIDDSGSGVDSGPLAAMAAGFGSSPSTAARNEEHRLHVGQDRDASSLAHETTASEEAKLDDSPAVDSSSLDLDMADEEEQVRREERRMMKMMGMKG